MTLREATLGEGDDASEPSAGGWGYLLSVALGCGLGAGAVLLVQRAGVQAETRSLNFDAETTDADMLLTGWSGFEQSEQRDSFAWCAAERCTLAVEAHGARERLIRARMWPFRFPGAPAQTATLRVNGSEVATVTLGDVAAVWYFRTPKEAWRTGRNVLSFDFAYAETPRAHLPPSMDARTLAAGFDWLEILPQ